MNSVINKKMVGRPKLTETQKKQPITIRLMPHTIEYLNSQKRSNSRIIEKALQLYRQEIVINDK